MTEYYIDKNGHKHSKDSRKKSRKKYYEKNKEKILGEAREAYDPEKARAYYKENKQVFKERYERTKDSRNKYAKDDLKDKRSIVFAAYGNKCVCCGEAHWEFLTVDHISNNGREHRKNNPTASSGVGFYRWIIKNNFPSDLQLLCANCHIAKSRGIICPHKS